jgi:hypothetical protein
LVGWIDAHHENTGSEYCVRYGQGAVDNEDEQHRAREHIPVGLVDPSSASGDWDIDGELRRMGGAEGDQKAAS